MKSALLQTLRTYSCVSMPKRATNISVKRTKKEKKNKINIKKKRKKFKERLMFHPHSVAFSTPITFALNVGELRSKMWYGESECYN